MYIDSYICYYFLLTTFITPKKLEFTFLRSCFQKKIGRFQTNNEYQLKFENYYNFVKIEIIQNNVTTIIIENDEKINRKFLF